MTHRWRNG